MDEKIIVQEVFEKMRKSIRTRMEDIVNVDYYVIRVKTLMEILEQGEKELLEAINDTSTVKGKD